MPFPTISVELFSINKCDGKCSSYLFIDLTYLSSLQQKKGKKSFFLRFQLHIIIMHRCTLHLCLDYTVQTKHAKTNAWL